MLLELMLGLWSAAAIAHFDRDGPLGRTCRTWAVELPAAWLATQTPGQLALAVFFVLALFTLAPAMPFEASLLAAGDLTAYLEVLGAVTLMAVRSRGVRAVVRDWVRHGVERASQAMRHVRMGGRERRARPTRPYRPAGRDDERPAASAPAFA